MKDCKNFILIFSGLITIRSTNNTCRLKLLINPKLEILLRKYINP